MLVISVDFTRRLTPDSLSVVREQSCPEAEEKRITNATVRNNDMVFFMILNFSILVDNL
jgi:hypothetical protein